MKTKRKPDESNGSDHGADGRFAVGNKAAVGHVKIHAAAVAKLRFAAINAVTTDDMRAVVLKLVELAREGNVPAAKEVLDRCLGKPLEADLVQRIEELETLLAEREGVAA